MPSDFPGAFAALREILRKHSHDMIVQTDTPSDFIVVTRAVGQNKKPIWFGCVSMKKSAVTYHLMPLYFNPKLEAAIAPELLSRKQGKTCFNFQRPDPRLFARLDELTKLAREAFERHGVLEPGQISYEKMDATTRAGGTDPAALAELRKAKGKEAARKRATTMRRKAAAPASR